MKEDKLPTGGPSLSHLHIHRGGSRGIQSVTHVVITARSRGQKGARNKEHKDGPLRQDRCGRHVYRNSIIT